MTQRYFHLGRRKRRLMMHEQAMGVVFNFGAAERQAKLSFELRELLEALIDVDAAFDGEANKDCCLVAGEDALNKKTNTVDGLIGQLKLAGLIDFESFSGGIRLVIKTETLAAFKRLERYAEMIDILTRYEDKGMELDTALISYRDVLVADGIYIGQSDQELDALMRKQIEPVVTQRREDRQLKKAAKKMTQMKALMIALATAVAATVATPDIALADRSGTIGLIYLIETVQYIP